MTVEFFMPMKPPTVTHQQKQVKVVKGKPIFYEPADLAVARTKLTAHLGKHAPDEKYKGPIELVTKWCFPLCADHKEGDYRTSRPDTDNLQKLLKDCMTAVGFWQDDAQVAREIVEKFWAKVPGIYIRVTEIAP